MPLGALAGLAPTPTHPPSSHGIHGRLYVRCMRHVCAPYAVRNRRRMRGPENARWPCLRGMRGMRGRAVRDVPVHGSAGDEHDAGADATNAWNGVAWRASGYYSLRSAGRAHVSSPRSRPFGADWAPVYPVPRKIDLRAFVSAWQRSPITAVSWSDPMYAGEKPQVRGLFARLVTRVIGRIRRETAGGNHFSRPRGRLSALGASLMHTQLSRKVPKGLRV